MRRAELGTVVDLEDEVRFVGRIDEVVGGEFLSRYGIDERQDDQQSWEQGGGGQHLFV